VESDFGNCGGGSERGEYRQSWLGKRGQIGKLILQMELEVSSVKF